MTLLLSHRLLVMATNHFWLGLYANMKLTQQARFAAVVSGTKSSRPIFIPMKRRDNSFTHKYVFDTIYNDATQSLNVNQAIPKI